MFHSYGLLDTCRISCLAQCNTTLIPFIYSLLDSAYSKVCYYLSEHQLQQCSSLCSSLLFHLRYKLLFFPFNLSLPYLPSSCWYPSLNPAKIPALLSQSHSKHNAALPLRIQVMTLPGSHIASISHVINCSGIDYNWYPQIKYNNLFVNYT